MNEEFSELISASVDGELDEVSQRRLMKAMQDDPALKARWQQYALIGDGLRHQLCAQPVHDLSLRVSEALNDETVVLRPKSARSYKALGGLAIAASVAMIALFGVRNLPVTEVQPQPLAQLDTAQPRVQSASIALVNNPGGLKWNRMRPATEKRLNTYLLKHYEYAPASGMSVILPYANIVGYESKATTE